MFAPEATIQSGSKWDFQVTLTGPVIDPTFLILLTSSDPTSVPVVAATELTAGQTSGAFLGGLPPLRGLRPDFLTAAIHLE